MEKLSARGVRIQKVIHDLYTECLSYCRAAEKIGACRQERTYKMADTLDTFLSKFINLNNHVIAVEDGGKEGASAESYPDRHI